jgi:hypothetical protein
VLIVDFNQQSTLSNQQSLSSVPDFPSSDMSLLAGQPTLIRAKKIVLVEADGPLAIYMSSEGLSGKSAGIS